MHARLFQQPGTTSSPLNPGEGKYSGGWGLANVGGGFYLYPMQEQYYFGPEQTQWLVNGRYIYDIRGVNLVWNLRKEPLERMEWSGFNAKVRLPRVQAPGTLKYWSICNHTLFVNPISSAQFPIELDCVLEPIFMPSSGEDTDIISPYNDLVPFLSMQCI